ncbi:MAG: type II toxin-antitoxin system RelE/ParE family toxin [Pyrinomonadaceae bacterium]
MRIEILEEAELDLIEGFHFYENQEAGLGLYFRTNLYTDIESLKNYAGIHSQPYKPYHRLLSRKFPFAIFYTVENDTVFIHAVLDCRKDPAWIRERLE